MSLAWQLPRCRSSIVAFGFSCLQKKALHLSAQKWMIWWWCGPRLFLPWFSFFGRIPTSAKCRTKDHFTLRYEKWRTHVAYFVSLHNSCLQYDSTTSKSDVYLVQNSSSLKYAPNSLWQLSKTLFLCLWASWELFKTLFLCLWDFWELSKTLFLCLWASWEPSAHYS
jgi:hypothetical protein